MANAARQGRRIVIGDVAGAYLKGKDPNGRIYWMRAPAGLKEFDPETGEELVYQVHGNMYGMKQAGAVWAACLVTWMGKMTSPAVKRTLAFLFAELRKV
jgi:hypothetical protein